MHFDLHLRRAVRDQIADLAVRMAAWAQHDPISTDERRRMVEAITSFRHTTRAEGLFVAGVDGSGDFPGLTYGDSYVYLSLASGVLYGSDALSGLKEERTETGTLVEFTWLSSRSIQCREALFGTFNRLASLPVEEVITQSDYRSLKAGRLSPEALRASLIIPPAHDGANIGIQLRTTAELGVALRLIETVPTGTLVLFDGTFALPFVQREEQSLFFEHLRRYCCVRARARGVIFAALSKSHGLPTNLRIEEAAREGMGSVDPEHWYLRFPDRQRDGWSFVPEDGPRIPPVGAVSYLVRLHRRTPIMRLDLDEVYWWEQIRGETDEATQANEQRLFGNLDYASHDQRSFGYPYPIKAAHDRASMTEVERLTFRKQVIEAAVGAGMRRSNFRDPSQLTGHAK